MEEPVSLNGRGPAGEGSALSSIDEKALRRAVELYRKNKKRADGPILFAGADLNGDGRPEALVLFSGANWCSKTGCSLTVFQRGELGYRPVSHVANVRGPVLVAPHSTFGWRDLIAKVGGGSSPMRDVRLAFKGSGYPANALLEPEATQDVIARSEQALAAPDVPTAALASGMDRVSGAGGNASGARGRAASATAKSTAAPLPQTAAEEPPAVAEPAADGQNAQASDEAR